MSVVCSRCSNVYGSASACPRCGAPSPVSDLDAELGHGPRWQQTVWGRIVIGLILAQGLFYGLRHLLIGIVLAVSEEGETDPLPRILLLMSMQVFGLFVGGLLAGGGKRAGLLLGALTGVWNGVLSLLLEQNPAQNAQGLGLITQPLLHAAVGAIAGWVGSVIWKPIPASGLPAALGGTRKVPLRPKASPFAGRIAWLRVILGTSFAVAGTLSATMIFQRIMDFTGKVEIVHDLQDGIITWEIRALAVLLGAALAGATTANGLKQGLCVGLWASVMLIGLQSAAAKDVFTLAVLTVISTMSLSLVGGWFGGQLFPPIIKMDRRRSIDNFA